MTATVTPAPARLRLPWSYRFWLAGTLASLLGDTLLGFALGWAATARGGGMAGLVLTTINLPRVVLLLFGGVAADRFGARRVMITAEAVMLAATSLLAAVAWLAGTPVWLLLGSGLVIGCVDALYLPASGSMPRRLVGEQLLPRALATRQAGGQLITLAAGPLGGLLVMAAGLGGAALADAVTFAAILVVLIVIPERGLAEKNLARRGMLREAADGVHLALTDRVLRPALVLTAAAAGFLLPVASLLIPLLARSHHWPAPAAGFVLGGQALGVVAVASFVMRFGRLGPPGVIASSGLLVASTGVTALSLAPTIPVAIAAAAGLGTGTGLLTTHLGPLVLASAPATHLARVQALVVLVQSLPLLVMNNALGTAAQAISPRGALIITACVLAASGISGLASAALRNAEMPGARD